MVDDFSSDFYDNCENLNSNKPRKRERRKRREERKKPISTRKVVNFPATQPYIRIVDGEERLCFKYNTKISETALSTMTATSVLEDYEFCVRFDIDSVNINRLSDKFKADNCIYPRANCEREQYKGNRWLYETECNRLAWQFVSLNPVLLYGKKGLIQRAVDTYRNSVKESRKRAANEEKLPNGSVRRKYADSITSACIFYAVRGTVRRVRIRIDIDAIDFAQIEPDFKNRYAVFPENYQPQDFGQVVCELKNSDNELAIKLAFANSENVSFWNAVRHTDKAFMLRKAVDAYKDVHYQDSSSTDDKEFSKIISDSLQGVEKNHMYEHDETFEFLN